MTSWGSRDPEELQLEIEQQTSMRTQVTLGSTCSTWPENAARSSSCHCKTAAGRTATQQARCRGEEDSMPNFLACLYCVDHLKIERYFVAVHIDRCKVWQRQWRRRRKSRCSPGLYSAGGQSLISRSRKDVLLSTRSLFEVDLAHDCEELIVTGASFVSKDFRRRLSARETQHNIIMSYFLLIINHDEYQ